MLPPKLPHRIALGSERFVELDYIDTDLGTLT